jgi:hypothetical protein
MSEPNCKICNHTHNDHIGTVPAGSDAMPCIRCNCAQYQAGSDSPKVPEQADDYRPTRESLSNAEIRATGLLGQGAVLNIARELIARRHQVASLEADNERLREENNEFERKFSQRESHWIRENARLQAEVARLESANEELRTTDERNRL